jgi:hypothetical protein
VLNWLEAAIPLRGRDAIAAAGRILAAMEPDLLASEYGRIHGIFKQPGAGDGLANNARLRRDATAPHASRSSARRPATG